MILFATNDAGPAKYLSYIAKSFKNENYKCLSSAISEKVFSNMDINTIGSIDSININDIDAKNNLFFGSTPNIDNLTQKLL